MAKGLMPLVGLDRQGKSSELCAAHSQSRTVGPSTPMPTLQPQPTLLHACMESLQPQCAPLSLHLLVAQH